jgi:ProP effector
METKIENKVNDTEVKAEAINNEAEVTTDTVEKTSESTTKETQETEVKRLSTKEIIAYLAEKFPACFSIGGPAKALKIGIFQDLAEKLTDDETVSKTRLRQALRHYTSSWRYLKAVKLGNFRVDIDGNDAAEIDQEQADYANKTLKESQEKFGNKNKHDKAGKKPYKGTKLNKSDNSSEGKSSTHSQAKRQEKQAKFKSVKSTKRPQVKVEVKLVPVESNAVIVGKNVKVKLGNSPMDAVITEVAGKDVSVQLNSGMVVKTQIKNIFTE